MRLTFYLLKNTLSNPVDALQSEKLSGEESFHDAGNELEAGFEYKIFIQENKSSAPKWVEFIKDYLSPHINLLNQINSFIIILKVDGRYFAVSGGQGFHALDKTKIESDFGLLCALNGLSGKIKSLDVKNIDINSKQTRVITSQEADPQFFGIDFDADLLRSIAGKPTDLTLGSHMKGSDSLSLSVDSNFTFGLLGEKCERLKQLYLSQDYKQNFEFIDRIKPIRDSQLVEELDLKLLEKIKTRTIDDKIIAVYPDQFEAENFEEIRIKVREQGQQVLDSLELSDVYSKLPNDITIEDIKKEIRITGYDTNGTPLGGKVPIYNILTTEIEHNEKLFVLSDRKWFEIDKSYLEKINNRLSQIPYYEDNLPPCTYNNEGEYNNYVATLPGYILLDRQLVRTPEMSSSIEIADLYEQKTKKFIHVKKFHSSAVLSHLFSQAETSASLLFYDDEYRIKCEQKIGEKIVPSEITVCFAIITNKDNALKKLPVFSKVNLYNKLKSMQKICKGIEVSRIIEE